MGFIFRFVDLAVFMIDQYVIHPPTVCTFVCPFVVGGVIELKFPKEDLTIPILVGINAQDGIAGAVDSCHNCGEVFSMFDSNETKPNNIDNMHQYNIK